MQASLSGKSIVIIGGTTGLGLAAARACLEVGAHVTAIGKDAESSSSAQYVLGGEARVLTADAREAATAEQGIALATETFGSVHGLYHVAGGSGRAFGDGPLHELSDEGWEETIHLNATSVMLSNRAVVRYFLKHQIAGSIVNVGSVLASSPSPRFFNTHAYAAAKAAIIGFSRSIAAYYAPQGIRINVVTPGLVDTPMAARAAGNPEIQRFIKDKQPLDGGRIGQPEDLDAAVVWLLSDAARFCTGQVIAVDGGWSLSEGGA